MLSGITKQFYASKCLLRKFNYKHRIKMKYYHNEDKEITAVNFVDIKKALKSTSNQVLEGYACLTTKFNYCQDNDTKKNCLVHVNKMTGYFICENCKRIGSWSTFERFLQPRKTKKANDEFLSFKNTIEVLPNFTEKYNQIKESAKSMENLSNEEYETIMEKFNLKFVPQEVMIQMNSFYDDSTQSLYFPLLAFRSLIVGYKSVSVDYTLSKTDPSMNATGVVIYKQKNMKSDGSAVIVPTVEDLLVVASEKAANLVICLPYGLKYIPQQILPSLESYQKLILWFGNDEPSWDTARQFARKLDEKRCHFVRPIEQQPRPKVAYDMGYNLKKIIDTAQPIWHKSITTFHSLRQDVLSDLQNVDKVQGIKWKRYPVLNTILKGHRRGEFTILTGPTGSGKTTFMSEYSLDLAMQGVNTLWGSFEIRNARLAKTMLQQMSGIPLESNLDKFNTFADKFEKLPIYFMTFHGQQNIKIVMEAVEHATYVHDIAHVIIDNVQFMLGMSEDPKFMDRFWKQDKVIAAFRAFATKFNCHVSLVIHPRKEEGDLSMSSIFGGVKASQEADNILIVQDKRLTSQRGKKFLQIAKNRYSGDLGIMPLEFDSNSLSYAQKKKTQLDSGVQVELVEKKPKSKAIVNI